MSAATDAPRLRRRRRAGRAAAGILAVVAVGGAAWAIASRDDSPTPAAGGTVPLTTATAQRRDLIERQDVGGTFGFSRTQSIGAPAAGTITRLRAEGDTVGRGHSLMSIDAEATAWVIYGTRPMYRDLGPGVTNGSDVRQLERNLAALGYDPGRVDADWTSSTTAAVKEFEEDRGLTEDGTLRRQDVVVSDGPARVGAHKRERGDVVQAGAPVSEVSSTTPVVTADVDAGLASSLRRGDKVEVTLPNGRTVRGALTRVGTVATAGSQDSDPTVEVRAALSSRRTGRLDGAPVTLSLAIDETKDVLAVPLTALVATGPGEYAVELAGSRRLIPVELGTSADGWVQVTGDGLAEGTRVVVPA